MAGPAPQCGREAYEGLTQGDGVRGRHAAASIRAFRSRAIQLAARLMRGGSSTTKAGTSHAWDAQGLHLFLLADPGRRCGCAAPARAQQQEKRVALVVGNGAYAKSPLATTANDAGLIAQTLQAAGFDVVGARDLDGDTLRKSLRDFIQKAQAPGPAPLR